MACEGWLIIISGQLLLASHIGICIVTAPCKDAWPQEDRKGDSRAGTCLIKGQYPRCVDINSLDPKEFILLSRE